MTLHKYTIRFGYKFCPAQLDYMFRADLQPSGESLNKTSHWKSSMTNPGYSEIIFDFTVTQWINTEEIIFLFAWWYQILHTGKKITVILPWYNAKISLTERLSKEEKQWYFFHFGYKFGDPSTSSDVKEQENEERRRTLNTSLILNWNLRFNKDLKEIQLEQLMSDTYYNAKFDYQRNNFTSKVIPFTVVKSEDHGEVLYFEDIFERDVTNNNLMTIESGLEHILRDHGCYSVFESRILTFVIFQELFFNTIQHAFGAGQPKLCYTGATFKQEKLSYATAAFKEEHELETLDFFKDKAAILKRLEVVAFGVKNPRPRRRSKIQLNEYEDLRPMSYIKYTFIDFGKGYTATLENNFRENIEIFRPHLSAGFDKAHLDAQIIEYAFLLETSSNPLDKSMEFYKYVPRGLYFLIDMVRRNKGLIKIRSGKGKVFYDFSDKIYVEVIEGKANLTLHSPFQNNEAVIHSASREIPYFEGTMISILLPQKELVTGGKQDLPAQKDARVLSPVRQISGILENYIYYLQDDKEMKYRYSYQDFENPEYGFISMVYVFHKAIKAYNESQKGTTDPLEKLFSHRNFYNYSFYALGKEMEKYEGKNVVIFFDFTDLHYTSQVLKVLYYLLETPRINELTKAVVTNLDKVSDSIIADINTQLKDENLGPKLYKPIPCFSFPQPGDDPLVQWIGLKESEHAPLLNKILLGEKIREHQRMRNSFNVAEDTEGNMFYEYSGKIYSFF